MSALAEIKPAEPRRKLWSRDECATLESSGLFDREHLELINGELISKMGQNRPHAITLARLCAWLMQTFGHDFVQPNAPIDVSPADNPTNEPEPDVIVLNRNMTEFSANPRPEDLRLVAEVSDSTLYFDLNQKASLYARAGITEYWVIDVQARRLIVHRSPVSGAWESVSVHTELETISPLSAPDREFSAAMALPL